VERSGNRSQADEPCEEPSQTKQRAAGRRAEGGARPGRERSLRPAERARQPHAERSEAGRRAERGAFGTLRSDGRAERHTCDNKNGAARPDGWWVGFREK
jgi:hypothetical protein